MKSATSVRHLPTVSKRLHHVTQPRASLCHELNLAHPHTHTPARVHAHCITNNADQETPDARFARYNARSTGEKLCVDLRAGIIRKKRHQVTSHRLSCCNTTICLGNAPLGALSRCVGVGWGRSRWRTGSVPAGSCVWRCRSRLCRGLWRRPAHSISTKKWYQITPNRCARGNSPVSLILASLTRGTGWGCHGGGPLLMDGHRHCFLKIPIRIPTANCDGISARHRLVVARRGEL